MERVQRNLLRVLRDDARVTRLSTLVEASADARRLVPEGVDVHEVNGLDEALAALRPPRAADRPDVYHLTFFADRRPTDLLLLAAANASVLSVTDAILNRHPEYHRSEREHAAYDRFTRALVQHSDRVVSFSESAKREAIDDLGAAEGNVDVASLAVDPGMASPLSAEQVTLRTRAMGVAGRWVLLVGKDYPHKDHAAAIEAMANQADDVGMVVAGERVWHQPLPGGHTFEGLVRARGLESRVHRITSANDEDLKALYQGAVALVYPSREEGFGLPPLEAMALGLPVVTTTAMSIPEVVGDAALTSPSGDAVALSVNLGRVIGDEAVREDLAARGRKRASEFSWTRVADGVVDGYRRAITGAEKRGDVPPRDAPAMLDMLDVIASYPFKDAGEIAAWKERAREIEVDFRGLEEKYRALQAAVPRWSLRRRWRKLTGRWK